MADYSKLYNELMTGDGGDDLYNNAELQKELFKYYHFPVGNRKDLALKYLNSQGYNQSADDAFQQNSQDAMNRFGLGEQGINNLYGQYEPQMLGDYNKASDTLGTLSDYANSTELSPWAQAEIERQKLEQGTSVDQLGKQLAGQQAGLYSNLASTGGLSGGAQERLGSAMATDRLKQLQGIYRQGAQQRAQIGAQDTASKQTTLNNLPGMYSALGQAKNQYYGGKLSNVIGARNKTASLWADMKANPPV